MNFDPLSKILGKKINIDIKSRNNGYDRESDIETKCGESFEWPTR